MTNEEIEKEFKEEWISHHTISKEGDSCWFCDCECGEKPIARHWFLAGRAKGQEEMNILEEACKSAIPCLEDWITITGFGAVCARDKLALKKIRMALGEKAK